MITRAMIFCAGLGTRFKPWTDKHPKALALVNGKTLLQRNIEYLQQYGIFEVVINVHHFADQIEEAVDESRGWGSTIFISNERENLLDTGGGLLQAASFFDAEGRFITLNADILTDLHIGKLIEFHERHSPLISLGVTDRASSRVFLFDKEDRLCGWRNTATGEERLTLSKPQLAAKGYSCVAIFEPIIFSLMTGYGFDGKFSLTDVYLKLAADHLILGYDHSGDRFIDVGKPESIAVAEQLFP